MENNRSVQWRRSPCALPSAVSSRRRMWHVSGVIFVKCFPFPFLPFSIPCVFNVLFPYISGIFLFMCDYWSCIIGWVCLTVAGELCSAPLLPPDLYMPVHPMCNNHCTAFDVSPPVLPSLRPAFRHSLEPSRRTSPCDSLRNKLFYTTRKANWEKISLNVSVLGIILNEGP